MTDEAFLQMQFVEPVESLEYLSHLDKGYIETCFLAKKEGTVVNYLIRKLTRDIQLVARFGLVE